MPDSINSCGRVVPQNHSILFLVTTWHYRKTRPNDDVCGLAADGILQFSFTGKVFQHFKFSAVLEFPLLIGVAVAVLARNPRAAAFNVIVVEEKHQSAGAEFRVETVEELRNARLGQVRPPEAGKARSEGAAHLVQSES